MLKYLLLAAAALLCLLSPAEARHRHHQHYAHHHHQHRQQIAAVQRTCDNMFCFNGGAAVPVRAEPARDRQAVSYGTSLPSFDSVIGRPVRFIAGKLVCAINVGSALAERGIKGTGSASALSYLHWGRSAGGPVPGAVIVSSRRGGGHVAIVSRVRNGVVYAWNATDGQRGWREIPYRHPVLDYRVPG